MLEMRPACERCEAELLPDAPGAWICSFECTFCERCATGSLSRTCPNCGGVLLPRPPRPTTERCPMPAAVVEG
jgi:hypothetical protein